MRLQSLFRRRPSASLIVSFLALFVALAGAGYAATQLPANSVGTAQLQNASVTNHKILNGSVGNFKLAFGAVGPRKIAIAAVGSNQINSSEVQARVTGTCATGSISSISSTGTVQCASAPAAEYGTSSSTTTLGTGSTPIASKALPAGSPFLVLAYPHVQISGASGNQVTVGCTQPDRRDGRPRPGRNDPAGSAGSSDRERRERRGDLHRRRLDRLAHRRCRDHDQRAADRQQQLVVVVAFAGASVGSTFAPTRSARLGGDEPPGSRVVSRA